MHHYMHGGPAAFRFELAGDLNAGDAAKLEQELRSGLRRAFELAGSGRASYTSKVT